MIGKFLDACRKANAFLQKIWPLLTGLGVAFGAVTLSGCGTMQTPSSKTQTSSVYAFGLPAVVITHDNKQVSDNSGDDDNFAQSGK